MVPVDAVRGSLWRGPLRANLDAMGPGMPHMRLTLAVVVCAVAVMATGVPAAAAEQVELTDIGGALHGILYRPEGAGPFPAVVTLHGCGGLVNRSGKIVARYADW